MYVHTTSRPLCPGIRGTEKANIQKQGERWQGKKPNTLNKSLRGGYATGNRLTHSLKYISLKYKSKP